MRLAQDLGARRLLKTRPVELVMIPHQFWAARVRRLQPRSPWQKGSFDGAFPRQERPPSVRPNAEMSFRGGATVDVIAVAWKMIGGFKLSTIYVQRDDRASVALPKGTKRIGMHPRNRWFDGASWRPILWPRHIPRKRMTSRRYIYVSENDRGMSIGTRRGKPVLQSVQR